MSQSERARRGVDEDRGGSQRPRGWFRSHPVWTTLILLAVVLVVIPLVIVGVTYNRTEIPRPGSVATNQISEIYQSDGTTMVGRIVPPEGNRTLVEIDAIPVHVRNAVIAAEDRSFYTNEGFDPTGIGRAVVGQVTGKSGAGGGSTITQQYVKNTMVGDARTYERKAKEIIIAAKMTNEWSKDQILEAYLNTIYFGRGAYGIAAASTAYFNKPVENLTVEEGAMLAGVIQSPSALDPLNNASASESRWNYVMDGMRDMGAIDAQQRGMATFPQVVEDPQAVEQNVGDPTNGPIRRQVLAELAQAGIDEQMLNTRGLKITTTIDPTTQAAVVNAARTNMQGENPENRTAVVSINPRTGGVIGYYGGEEAEGWDYANAPLQTGSTFKVFGVAAALDQGIGLGTQISSAPVTTGDVTVTNVDGQSCGSCSISQALKMSLNTSFIRLQRLLDNGANDVRDMAHRVGIPKEIPGLPWETLSEQGEDPYDGLILGQYPIRVRDMATGLATFAAEGVHRPTHFIQKVETADGEVLLDSTSVEGEEVVSADVANNLTSAMEPIAAYSNGHSLAGGRPSAAKSGTTQLGDTGYNKDAWFVGYTPSNATAVWVGTDENKPLFNSYGGVMYGASVPADIWKSAMDGALANAPWEDFPEPGYIGGQAGTSQWESSGTGSGTGDETVATEQFVPQTSAAPAPVAPAPAPQAPGPLTLNVPGLPEIVIPGAGAPAPVPAPVPAPAPEPAVPGGGGEAGGGGTAGDDGA
ncbi:transglycosylase domain-containing protein [Rhodococcus sp. IEGM 1408]|uniref:transglycosylase domain-containing protein n=1 Tax=Rhodococcus sp. IEGM 1408 TaxID=3082220 RepID=UPI0029534AEF|nr:transglycosylase domain-containing protein [Rhodococcus sp. IEGM 1408]MDV7999999.1 transglycosylase domain-containing protein [Rhodococcus sp. IEGM 1408]